MMNFKGLKPFQLIVVATIMIFTWTQCSTSKPTVQTVEHRVIDTVFVTAPRVDSDEANEQIVMEANPYHGTHTSTIDIKHTQLDLSFDWPNRKVIGTANITLSPYFFPTNMIELDAKNFEVKKASIKVGDMLIDPKIENDGKKIRLHSPNVIFKKSDELMVSIEYVASPYAADGGGSTAITSDRGLFFINPTGTEKNKPTQIWTQGETESNSRWFPTVDKPNEKTTQDISVTIPDNMVSLSNGNKVSSNNNGDGTITERWVLDQPHAPYLFMLAIGEYAVVKDMWQGKEVSYYVEPEYKEDARDIFGNTKEMLTYFSDLLDYPYPWPKYSQVTGRDYVSGAMENTTAVLYGQFVQKPSMDLIDNNNDGIVAHEMFHHWFGDLVTCESWSNLTLNEGFANYSEYLWQEHKYGREAADQHRYFEFRGYLNQAKNNVHPLIDFNYHDKEDMFDSHSYNKGGLVLHMLRDIFGDEAFFKSLNYYLTTMQYKAVEVHDLRLAFEAITGNDLNWFFNQWYLAEGHPKLEVNYTRVPDSKGIQIQVDQVQDATWPMFRIPIEFMFIATNGNKWNETYWVDQRTSTIDVEVQNNDQIQYVITDPRAVLLAEIELLYDVPDEVVFENAISIEPRLKALSKILRSEDIEDKSKWYALASSADFYGTRKLVVDNGVLDDKTLVQIAANDANAQVRTSAVNKIEDVKSNEQALMNILQNDASNIVRASAAKQLITVLESPESLFPYLEDSRSTSLLNVKAAILAESGKPEAANFFETHQHDVSFGDLFPYYSSWATYLNNLKDASAITNQLNSWKAVVGNKETNIYNKYAIMQGLTQIGSLPNLEEASKTQLTNLVTEISAEAAQSLH